MFDAKSKYRGGRLNEHIKSVQEFFSDAVEACTDSDLPTALAKALPWATDISEAVGHALQEALPPVKFVVKLFEKLTKETNPESLGFLALTIAYQHAVAKSLKAVGSPQTAKPPNREIRRTLEAMEPCEGVDMGSFSRENALAHPFIHRADALLRAVLAETGYGEPEISKIEEEVHSHFQSCLATLLADGETAEKFSPFTRLLQLGSSGNRQSYLALHFHAEMQRRLFEEAPVFGQEPFALQHVYVET